MVLGERLDATADAVAGADRSGVTSVIVASSLALRTFRSAPPQRAPRSLLGPAAASEPNRAL
jgi:hypothetical protein